MNAAAKEAPSAMEVDCPHNPVYDFILAKNHKAVRSFFAKRSADSGPFDFTCWVSEPPPPPGRGTENPRKQRSTLLHLAAAEMLDVKMCKILLDVGMDVNATEMDMGSVALGQTALDDTLNRFIDNDDLTVRERFRKQQFEVVKFLVERGSRISVSRGFCLVITAGLTEILEVLMNSKRVDANQRSPDGQLPLVLAALTGNSDSTRMLLEHGADPALFCDIWLDRVYPFQAAFLPKNRVPVELILKLFRRSLTSHLAESLLILEVCIGWKDFQGLTLLCQSGVILYVTPTAMEAWLELIKSSSSAMEAFASNDMLVDVVPWTSQQVLPPRLKESILSLQHLARHAVRSHLFSLGKEFPEIDAGLRATQKSAGGRQVLPKRLASYVLGVWTDCSV